jgi:hypothetical protein
MDHPHHRHLQQCDECEQSAVWVRRTQFAGNHYFCTLHAQREEDFFVVLSSPSWPALGAHLTNMGYTVATARRLVY